MKKAGRKPKATVDLCFCGRVAGHRGWHRGQKKNRAISYAKVIDDLESERDNIEAAIAALRAVSLGRG